MGRASEALISPHDYQFVYHPVFSASEFVPKLCQLPVATGKMERQIGIRSPSLQQRILTAGKSPKTVL
jgi:hypothetical protein